MRFLFILLGLLLFFSTPLSALIGNTLHNLSVTNTHIPDAQHPEQIVKAITETEECVFCHVPHLARPQGSPLWNRAMPDSSYNMYESDYLKRIGYPEATSLGTLNGEPGTRSRQCLSCHDGTIAIGSIYKLRHDLMGGASVVMAGTEGGIMPSTSPAKFGTDLTNHHPVGIAYEAGAGIIRVFGDGSSVTSELKVIPDSPIKLYDYGGTKYVECASCHDPHTENTKFLRMGSGTPATSHGTNVLNTCLACHEKEGWNGSAHQSANNAYIDSNVSSRYGVNTVAGLGCINCHTPHNGEGVPTLLRKVEENTCFQGAAGSVGGAACHGAGGAKDIESIITKTYAHPTISLTTQGKHTGLDALYGEGHSETDAQVGKGVDWSNSKHAECMDCHNPHKTQPGTHTPSGQWYPTTPSVNTNLVSNVLTGVSGVEPTWPAAGWVQPTTFTTLKSATKEYQICMKCHSYWGLGPATFGASSFNLSTEGTIVTDQAWEFSPKNRAAHPVVMTTNQMRANGGDRYAYPVHSITMLPPWNTNVGNQTMYCSDCHGSDNEDTIDSKGPHGSSKKYMLKGQYKDWPENSATGQPWHIGDVLDANGYNLAVTGEIFCLNCHNIEAVAGNDAINGAHRIKSTMESLITPGTYVKCINCHVAVPHGSPVSRLIGYYNFPEPYNYNGNSLMLTGYRSNYSAVDTPVYNWGDAYLVDHNGSTPGYPAIDTVPTCGGNGSSFCHGTDGGGYDPWIVLP